MVQGSTEIGGGADIYMITESGANVRREWHSELPSKRIKIIKLYGSGKAKFR